MVELRWSRSDNKGIHPYRPGPPVGDTLQQYPGLWCWSRRLTSCFLLHLLSPNSFSAADNLLITLLASLLEFSNQTILAGDFNSGHINWDTQSHSVPSPFEHTLILFVGDTPHSFSSMSLARITQIFSIWCLASLAVRATIRSSISALLVIKMWW